MGVNCRAVLSPKARWEYVGEVASILLGAKAHKEPLGNSFHTVVDGFKRHKSWDATGDPGYIDILVTGDVSNPVAKAIQDSDSLPYRLWYGLERKTLYPKATAAKIALVLAITKFFGGDITYNGCSGASAKFPTRKWIGASDGKDWERLHQEMLDLKPLTQKDIDACQKWAAY